MLRVRSLRQTRESRPSEWDGEFEDGSGVRVTYDCGCLTVEHGEARVPLLQRQLGWPEDGWMSTVAMLVGAGLRFEAG